MKLGQKLRRTRILVDVPTSLGLGGYMYILNDLHGTYDRMGAISKERKSKRVTDNTEVFREFPLSEEYRFQRHTGGGYRCHN